MNYCIVTILVLVFSTIYEKAYSSTLTKKISFFIICLSLIVFASLRSSYNDTADYIQNFNYISESVGYLRLDQSFTVSNVYLFRMFSWLFHNYISSNYHCFLFACSCVFVIPTMKLIAKYARHFQFSVLIYMTVGLYLFSLAGLKQSIAIGIMAIGFDYYLNNHKIKYLICVILATGFHTFSVVYLIVLLTGKGAFSRRSNFVYIGIIFSGILFSHISSFVSYMISLLGKNVSEEVLSSGSMTIFRTIVYALPLFLAFLGRHYIRYDYIEAQMMKWAAISASFAILSFFANPILFGRVTFYFMIESVVIIPTLIEKLCVNNIQNMQLLDIVAKVGYLAFGIYSIYDEGGFVTDIFRLTFMR